MDISHSRPLVHSSELTKGTKCDGCLALEVLVSRRRAKETESHWCNNLHGRIDVHGVECPGGARYAKKPL